MIPLNVVLICWIKDKVLQVLLYSRMQLAITSSHAISILYVLAIVRGYNYLIVKKDSSNSNIRFKETFIAKLIKAN